MPYGPGTYGKQVGRPSKKDKLPQSRELLIDKMKTSNKKPDKGYA